MESNMEDHDFDATNSGYIAINSHFAGFSYF